jgi:hypothetical protein
MKKLVSIVCLSLCFLTIYAQDRGIGLRLGTPMGITYKKYLPRDKAVEFGLGTGYTTWYHNYYENSFHDFDRYEGFDYVSHTVRAPLYLQGRYLFHQDIHVEGMVGELEWYWGIGALMKVANVDYRYRDDGVLITDRRTDLDFGPEGMLGMEYTFRDIPLTIFGEFSLMIEFADRPGALRGYSGVGARYNF